MNNDFASLGISKDMVKLLKQNGISEPTSVQEQSIPVLLMGKDIIAQAQTGTGKTLAFLLPIMDKIDVTKTYVQALIITPTRELAIQITAETKKYAALKGANILAAYGGQDVEQQVKKLKGANHIVIGTPGRLLDHLRRKTIDFSSLLVLVLDEADQMLDMGFLKEVEEIIHHTKKKRQTMLFSATMPKGIKMLASKYLHEPVQIRVQSKNVTLDEIKQIVVETTDRGKQDALCKTIEEFKPFMAMIFCRTKRRVSDLNEALIARGYVSDELHGDLTQGKREKVMKAFRKVELHLLVATDIAARGLDIDGVTHIFNYDIPQDAEDYIHRIGRTGRAGQTGMAVTFVTQKDRVTLMEIEKGINSRLEKHRVDYTETPENKEATDKVRKAAPKDASKGKRFGTGQGKRTTFDRKTGERSSFGKKPSLGKTLSVGKSSSIARGTSESRSPSAGRSPSAERSPSAGRGSYAQRSQNVGKSSNRRPSGPRKSF